EYRIFTDGIQLLKCPVHVQWIQIVRRYPVSKESDLKDPSGDIWQKYPCTWILLSVKHVLKRVRRVVSKQFRIIELNRRRGIMSYTAIIGISICHIAIDSFRIN